MQVYDGQISVLESTNDNYVQIHTHTQKPKVYKKALWIYPCSHTINKHTQVAGISKKSQ